MITQTKKHGGSRPGAGRPKKFKGATARITFTVPKVYREQIQKEMQKVLDKYIG